jgi:hypothetical protein
MFNYLLYFFKQNKKIVNTTPKQYDFTCHPDYKMYKKNDSYKSINASSLKLI